MTDERFDSFLRGLQRAEQFRNNQKRAKMIQGKNWKVFQGNNLDVLPTLEDNSIDAIVTDPPYELGFMGKKWDSSGIAYNVELWRECLRVLKPGGHLLAFSGSRTYHRMVVAIEDADFEIRDMISWISDKTFPKSLNVGKATEDEKWQGWGTALKPTVEPIVMARKPLIGTVAENVLTYATGGLNIEGSRVEAVDQEKLEKYWDRTQSISAEEGRNAMSGGLKAIDLSDRKPQGRWPANVILDETTEEILGEPARFFYVARASKRDRNEGLEELPKVQKSIGQETFATICPAHKTQKELCGCPAWQPVANFHPTVKPTDLMRYLIKLVTPPGGVVLDPFTGSGSTGKAAILEGFDFIGIELTEEYLPIIEGRLKWAEAQRNLSEAKKDEALF